MQNGIIPVNKHGNVEVWDFNESFVPKGARRVFIFLIFYFAFLFLFFRFPFGIYSWWEINLFFQVFMVVSTFKILNFSEENLLILYLLTDFFNLVLQLKPRKV